MKKKELVFILLHGKGSERQLMIAISDFLIDYPEFDVIQVFHSITGRYITATIRGMYPEDEISDIERLSHHGESFYQHSNIEDARIEVFHFNNTVKNTQISSFPLIDDGGCKKPLNIWFDLDDTLWDLNDYVYNKAGINGLSLSDATVFNCEYNKNLTDYQKNAIMLCYSDPETFQKLEFVDGVDEICELQDGDRANITIASSCCSFNVHQVKLRRLGEIKRSDSFYSSLTVYPNHSRGPGDILVDDSMENIRNTDFRFYILIDKPWNTNRVEFLDVLSSKHIYRVSSLKEAIEIIKMLQESLFN